ncbi:MAG: hypothetical protein ABIW76_07360 [Fibrobacteria bacterium]
MSLFRYGSPVLVFSLALLAASCMDDSGGGKTPTGNGPSFGSFQVSLVEPTGTTQGFTSVLGLINTGPTPSSFIWEEGAKSGSCRIFTPRVPFCETTCGSDAICVENNTCRDSPTPISVGKVSVNGLKTKAGAASFNMDPIRNLYQPAGGVILAFPPFAEGDAVTFTAGGDTSVAAFTVSAKGIAPLAALKDSFALADGKPIELEWTPPKDPGASFVSVLVDLSHHGGTKGKIECEGPDNGKLEIAAVLVDQLKALGVSGFPKIEISRKVISTNADVNVSLVLESLVTRPLAIPGLISCIENVECPDGLTCQKDFRCK